MTLKHPTQSKLIVFHTATQTESFKYIYLLQLQILNILDDADDGNTTDTLSYKILENNGLSVLSVDNYDPDQIKFI